MQPNHNVDFYLCWVYAPCRHMMMKHRRRPNGRIERIMRIPRKQKKRHVCRCRRNAAHFKRNESGNCQTRWQNKNICRKIIISTGTAVESLKAKFSISHSPFAIQYSHSCVHCSRILSASHSHHGAAIQFSHRGWGVCVQVCNVGCRCIAIEGMHKR